MLRKQIRKPVLISSAPRGGFLQNPAPAKQEEKQEGRGNFNKQQSKGFEPPKEVNKDLVKKRSKTGNLVLIEKKDKKKEEKEKQELIDDNNNINWEEIEKDKKRRPCVKLLKKLAKKSGNNKEKKIGNLFFNLFNQ